MIAGRVPGVISAGPYTGQEADVWLRLLLTWQSAHCITRNRLGGLALSFGSTPISADIGGRLLFLPGRLKDEDAAKTMASPGFVVSAPERC